MENMPSEGLALHKRYPLSYRVVLKEVFPALLGAILAISGCFIFYRFTTDSRLMQLLELVVIPVTITAITIFLIKLAYQLIYRGTYRYVIQDGQFVIIKGVFLKNRGAFPFAGIVDIYLKRNFFDFLMGLYNLHLATPSSTSHEFAKVEGLSRNNALALQKYVSSIVEAWHATENPRNVTIIRPSVQTGNEQESTFGSVAPRPDSDSQGPLPH